MHGAAIQQQTTTTTNNNNKQRWSPEEAKMHRYGHYQDTG
jgi:hypothetical protein